MNEIQKGELLKISNDQMLTTALESYFEDRFRNKLDKLLRVNKLASTEMLGEISKALALAKDEINEALVEIKNLGKGREVLKDNQNPAR